MYCCCPNQAPPGFQEQSQEEDHADRLKDYADLQATLEVQTDGCDTAGELVSTSLYRFKHQLSVVVYIRRDEISFDRRKKERISKFRSKRVCYEADRPRYRPTLCKL